MYDWWRSARGSRVWSAGGIPQFPGIFSVTQRVRSTRSTLACRPPVMVSVRCRIFARFEGLSARARDARRQGPVPITADAAAARFYGSACGCSTFRTRWTRAQSFRRRRAVGARRRAVPGPWQSVRYTPAASSPARFRAQPPRDRRNACQTARRRSHGHR